MSVELPIADEVRALVISIERYPGLGDSFDTPGGVAGALAFAQWLVEQHAVPPQAIELWLAPLAGSGVDHFCAGTELAGASVRAFDWAAFRAAVAEPQGPFNSGRFLMVYFCGHGVVSGARGQQYLVLPEATERQFRCFEVQNWRELFRGSGWERFSHQLWIIDACRNQWGDAMQPLPDEWHPGAPNPVRQCAMFACASGEAAAIDSRKGPRFTHELIQALTAAGNATWPAFDRVLADTAARLRADPNASQNPGLSIGEDWFGLPMAGAGLAGESLHAVLSAIPWAFERFKPYIRSVQAVCPAHIGAWDDLDGALELLNGLPRVAGVAPLLDFAERVARAAPSPRLQAWVDARLSPQQKAELDARLAAAAVHARLSLWYRDDYSEPCMEGELDIIDAGGGVLPWQRPPAKAVTSDDITATIGAWMQAAYSHLGAWPKELVIDLYLPKRFLADMLLDYDVATVPMAADDELRLGEDHPALLRCTDRYKGQTKLSRWRKHAPAILARLGERTAPPLRWVVRGDSSAGLKHAFISHEATAPVWLGFDSVSCGGGDSPLDAALTEGLPAVTWLRAAATDVEIAALCTELQELLLSPLDQLPARLVEWRSHHRHHAGATLALLLDDPARMPAIWTSWTQPGE